MFLFFRFYVCWISENAIRHLAGADHMKKVKGFLWKYGGGMDKVDTFRITETDFAKVLVMYFKFILFPRYRKPMLLVRSSRLHVRMSLNISISKFYN